jgi:membrane protein DedA with SNARE-associated domain
MWTAIVIWLALSLVVWFDASDALRRGFFVMVAINGPMMLAAGIFIWWRGRRSLARIARFEALREQLRGP